MRYKRHHKKSNKRLKVRKHRHVQAPKGSKLCGKCAELFLSDEEKSFVNRLLGCARLVYNLCLGYNNHWYALYKEALKKNEEQPGAVPKEELKRIKKNCNINILPDVFEAYKSMDEYSFLRECNQKVLQQSVRHLIQAFRDFFDPKQKNKRHPKFKKKYSNEDSCEFNSQAFGGISGNRLNLIGGLQNILFKCSAEDTSYLNQNMELIQKVTLTKTKSNRYFIAFNLIDVREKRVNPKSTSYISDNVRQMASDVNIDNEKHVFYTDDKREVGDYLVVTNKTTGEVEILSAGGIDPGIKTKGYCSDGTVYENPRVYDKMHKREAMLQRRLSKTQTRSKDYKGMKPYEIPKNSPNAGKNHEKARLKLAKYREHMANVRENDTQKMTTDFVMKHDIIFREDTNVAGMMRNHKIARALQDAAIGEVNHQIDYKCAFYGKKCIKVGRWFASSKICNHCGHKNDDLKLSDRVWVCPHCGKVVIRDYNASRNILEEGIRLLREELGDNYIVTHICVLKTQIDDKCSQSTELGEVGSSSPNPAGINR